MNVMSLMATIGVDIKQFEKDLQKVSRIGKQFSRSAENSKIDIDVNVDASNAESQIDDIISLVSTASGYSVDINADANLDIDDYTSGISTITDAANDIDADVNGDASLDVTAYNDNVDTIETSAADAAVDVDGDADLDITSYVSGIDDIESDASSADVDVNGDAALDITNYTDNIDTIESDATSAAVDVDGTADLNIDGYQTDVDTVEELAAGAAADINGTATITATVVGDEEVSDLIESIGTVESSSSSADSALKSIGQGISFQNVTSALDGIVHSLESIISKAVQAGKALVDMSVDASDWGDTILTESQEYGIDTDTIQRMRYASRFVDTEVGAIENSWQYMTRQLANGSDTATEAYEKMGVATHDMNGNLRPTQDIFWDTVDALHEMGDSTEREALMTQTLGRSYTQLNPLVKAGSEAYQDYMNKAYVVDEERVNQLGEYNDAIQDLTANAEATKLQLMADLAPAFAEAATALSGFLDEFNSFMSTDEGREAIQSLRDAISELIQSVTGDINIEDVFSTLNGAVKTFTDAVQWVGENSGTVVGAFEGIAAAITGMKVASGVLKFLQLVQGVKNLNFGGGGNGDGGGDTSGGGSVASAAGGGLFRRVLTLGQKALPVVANALPYALPVGLAAASLGGGGYLMHNLFTFHEREYGDYDRATEHIPEAEEALSTYNDTLEETKTSLQDFVNGSADGAYQLGQTGEEVEAIQKTLQDADYNLGEKGVDGIFGKDTQAAYDQYISDKKAEAQSYIDQIEQEQQSVGKLNDIYKKAQAGANAEDYAEQFAQAKDLMAEYGNEIEQMFPDMKIFEQMRGYLEEGANITDFFKLDNADEFFGASGEFSTFLEDVITNITEALNGAGESEEGGLLNNLIGDGTEVTALAEEIGSTAKETLSTEVEGGLTEGAESGSTAMETAITMAAGPAAEEVGTLLDEAIGKERTLNIKLGVTGGGKFESLLDLNGNTRRHATAMSRGEILRGLTPFGMDANGTMHYGGEAGAEAVVGVNSLDSMIQESVRNAIGAVLGKMDQLIGGQNQGDLKIVMDSGAMVGQLVKGMDRQLGSTVRRRGGGRT